MIDDLRIERASEQAVPSAGVERLGAWRAHLSDGYVRRLNSVALHGERPGGAETERRLDVIDRLYRERSLRPAIRQTTMDGWLDEHLSGWTETGDTIVMAARGSTGDVGPTCSVEDWLAWLSPRASLPARFAEAAASARRLDADNVVLFSTEGRHIVGAGRAVSTEGMTGLFDISVDSDVRRRGHGRSLLRRLMAWAAERGEEVYLQVGAVNEPALQLYRSEGFVERYRYRYRRRD